jgi:hypothetical protein
MSHLTDEQLSALVDDALDAGARAALESHLETCAACREALAGLAAQERGLRAALEHDPGAAYFEDFAARVGGRLRAAGQESAPARVGAESRGLADWFRSPRKLALLGTVGVLVAGAGVVIMVTREARMPVLREREIESRAAQEAAGGPAMVQPKPEATAPPRAKPSEQAVPLREQPAPQNRPAPAAESSPRRMNERAALGRAYQVRREASGEDVAVGRPTGFAYQPPGPAYVPAPPGAVVHAPKQRYALPASPETRVSEEKAAAPHGGAQPVTAEEGAPAASAADQAVGRAPEKLAAGAENLLAQREQALAPRKVGPAVPGSVCGEIADQAGRPIAGAQVVNRTTGANVTTAPDGSFCLAAKGRTQELVVMAVGFKPLWRTVSAGERPRIVLETVSVLGGKNARPTNAALRDARLAVDRGGADQRAGASADLFAHQGTFARIHGANALRLTTLAEQMGVSSAWDSALTEWRRVLDDVKGGPLDSRVRYEIARARLMGWRVDRTQVRAGQTRQAVDELLASSPSAAARDSARTWLDELRK